MISRIDRLAPWIASVAIAGGSFMFACSDDPTGAPGTGGDATSSPASTDAATTAPGSQAVVTNAVSTSTGMSNFDCDPAAEPGSIFELDDAEVFPPNDVRSMCEFRGDVMLIFNAAAI